MVYGRWRGTEALTGPVVEEYLAARRAAGYTAYLTSKALAPLRGYLRGLGVAPQAESATPATPREALLEEYRCYLLAERGVQAEVALGYLDLVRPFVAHHHAAAGAVALSGLSAADVTGFLTAESRRLVPKTAQRLATALRSLLRSWHPQGLISGPLDGRCPRSPTAGPGFPGRWGRAVGMPVRCCCGAVPAAGCGWAVLGRGVRRGRWW